MAEADRLGETLGVADPSSEARLEPAATAPARAVPWTRVGVVLLGISALLWFPLPIVPFLPMSAAAKAALAGGLVVAAEIAFWAGAVLAGPVAVARLRSWARRTFGRRS